MSLSTLRYWFLLSVLLCGWFGVRASHIVGMDLKYQHISGDNYRITCIVYGDCGAASHAAFVTLYNASPKINVFDGSSYVNCVDLSITAPDSGVDISHFVMCPQDTSLTTCVDMSNPYPGIKKFTYVGNYVVPHQSANWRFVFAGNLGTSTSAGRAAAITNIQTPNSTITQLEASLNNMTGNNSSPNLSVEPVLFFCENNADTYNPAAIDPDNDSLDFQLVSGMNAGTTSCPCSAGSATSYVASLSGTNPLQVVPGSFTFQPLNGQISFTPSAIQRSMVVYKINEYRGGVLVGSSQREMNFIVEPCTVTPPTITVGGVSNGLISSDSSTVEVCSNSGTLSFNLDVHEADTINHIYVTGLGLPPGAVLNVVADSTNSPHCIFTWNMTGVAPGIYTFYLKIQDNNCPVEGESVLGFTVHVASAGPAILGPGTLCVGDSASMSVSEAGGVWTSSTSGIAVIDTTTGILRATGMGLDTVSYRIDSTGCSSVKVVTVYPIPTLTPLTHGLCIGTTDTLISAASSVAWSVTNGNAIVDGGGIVTGVATGKDTVICDIGGCVATTVVTVDASPTPVTGPSGSCMGITANLADLTPGGVWSTTATNFTISSTGIVTPVAAGSGTVVYTLPDNCAASVNFVIYPKPVISGADSGCTSQSSVLTADVSGGSWTSLRPAVGTVTSSGSATGIFTGHTAGYDTVVYQTPNGCRDTLKLPVYQTVPVSVTITDTPAYWICYGIPVRFDGTYTNGGAHRQLIWTVNGATVDTGLSYTYLPTPGDRVRCILIADTVCAQPYPDTSNTIVPLVNLNVPKLTMTSLYGDTSCAGLPNTYTIASADTGVDPQYVWSVNYTTVATNVHTFTYTPANGDIIICSMTVDVPCSFPNPAVVTDTLSVFTYQTPTLGLNAGGAVVCQGNPITIAPFWTWGGTYPVFEWSVNGVFAESGGSYTYVPANGDTVSCIMISDFPCVTPNDTAVNKVGITIDSVLHVQITATPGALIAVGQYDTLHATVWKGGISPTYQWRLNGMDLPGEIYPDLVRNTFANRDSVTCVVTTGSGTPCQGVEGFNWLILEVAPVGVASVTEEVKPFVVEPNPSKGMFRIDGTFGEGQTSISVYDLAGRAVYSTILQTSATTNRVQIELPGDLANGMYILRIESDKNCVRIPIVLDK
jgi:Secretion system C-terminal sorting domain